MLTKLEKQKKMLDLPIGVFDSGIGGISVLAELINEMPNENFVYFADSDNAPYGNKTTEEVKQLSINAVNILIDYGIKSLVVACNTATSAAINELRSRWRIPIVGMEPALKPAFEANKDGKIIVMATPVTIKEEKFTELINKFSNETEIIKLACPGLAWIIEKSGSGGQSHRSKIGYYLKKLFKDISFKVNDSIVLGCTHYVYIKDDITKIIGEDVLLFDGNIGTAKQLGRMLNENKLAKQSSMTKRKTVTIKMINSCNLAEKKAISEKLLLRCLDTAKFRKINFV